MKPRNVLLACIVSGLLSLAAFFVGAYAWLDRRW